MWTLDPRSVRRQFPAQKYQSSPCSPPVHPLSSICIPHHPSTCILIDHHPSSSIDKQHQPASCFRHLSTSILVNRYPASSWDTQGYAGPYQGSFTLYLLLLRPLLPLPPASSSSCISSTFPFGPILILPSSSSPSSTTPFSVASLPQPWLSFGPTEPSRWPKLHHFLRLRLEWRSRRLAVCSSTSA